MYIGYFFNSNGKYQNKMYFDDIYEILQVGMENRDLVPHIMFTENDNSIFELKDGEIIWPEFPENEIIALKMRYMPLPNDFDFHTALINYIEILQKKGLAIFD